MRCACPLTALCFRDGFCSENPAVCLGAVCSLCMRQAIAGCFSHVKGSLIRTDSALRDKAVLVRAAAASGLWMLLSCSHGVCEVCVWSLGVCAALPPLRGPGHCLCSERASRVRAGSLLCDAAVLGWAAAASGFQGLLC